MWSSDLESQRVEAKTDTVFIMAGETHRGQVAGIWFYQQRQDYLTVLLVGKTLLQKATTKHEVLLVILMW